MKNNPCHNQLLSLLYSQKAQMDALYNSLSRELSVVLKQYKVKSSNGTWVRNTQIENRVDKILLEFNSRLINNINSQSSLSWNLSEDCNDTLVQGYLKGVEIDTQKKEGLLFRNNGALQSFIQRKSLGLGLSDRVWNLTTKSKEQLEYLLQSGIMEGRSATKLAGDLKSYLKEPNRRYRRIRDKNGKLIYSEPAKNFKPGQGVYRSSYKNALRLSRNEINIAYRTADFERRSKMDFARGITVHLSSAHPRYDICDELVGDYPLDFKFVGWHTNCLCYTTTLLLSKKEFVRQLNGGKIRDDRFVTSIPQRAENHINSIAHRIKGWKNKPYFIVDNFKNTKEGFALRSGVTKIKTNRIPDVPKPKVETQSFIAAKNIAEAEDRLRAVGISDVSLKGLKASEFNAVLDVFESESNFSKLNLSKLSTYRRGRSQALALYSQSKNEISINVSNIKKIVPRTITSYPDQVKKLEKTIKEFQDNYLGNPKYKQTTVKARLNSFRRRVNEIERKIKNGEKARHWIVADTYKQKEDGLKAIVIHEIGHYRHYKQVGEKAYFRFSERLSISEYGRTNPKEYFAEWYAHYRLKGENEVPEDLLKLFKSIKND